MARQRELQALHSKAPVPPGPVPPGPVDRKSGRTLHIEHLFRKTKLCAFFQRGGCNKGRECGFAHGEQDLNVRPDLTKTVMCSAWLRRHSCRAGNSCRFAHGAAELRREPPKDARDCDGESSQTTCSDSDKGRDFSSNREEVKLLVLQHLFELSSAEAKLVEAALASGDGVQKRACCKMLELKLQLAAPDFYED